LGSVDLGDEDGVDVAFFIAALRRWSVSSALTGTGGFAASGLTTGFGAGWATDFSVG
jgi:hypothetical protein